MFRLSTCEIVNRYAMIVEDDHHEADRIAAAVSAAGGFIAGLASDIPGALGAVAEVAVDIVILHIRYVGDVDVPIQTLFSPLGIETCFDDWWSIEEDMQPPTAAAEI